MTNPIVKKQKPRGRAVRQSADEIKRDATITPEDVQAVQATYGDDADLLAMLEAKPEKPNA